MKYQHNKWIITFLTFAAALFIIGTLHAAEEDWPREIIVPEAKIIIYQPQLESFKDDKLTARAAVSVMKTGMSEPVFGAVWIAARVSTDRNTRIVKPLEVRVTKSKFPESDSSKASKFAGILEREIPKWDLSISLDRLLTMLELVEKKKAAAADLKTTPPKIIFVTHPAVLVTIDGEPELRKVENSKLMRVANTPFFILFEPTSKNYYLKGSDSWFASDDIKGSWKSEPKPPASVLAAASSELSEHDKGPDAEKRSDRMPQIIVTTTPAELIMTDGETKYKTISGTDLLYVSNTENDLFMQISTQKHFVLLSGRWYSSESMKGPWSFVSSDKLPADFKKITPYSDKAKVLASVAGTEAAKEAVLDTYIPQTTALNRKDAVKVVVEYDGPAKFDKIEGTSMFYAINTPYSVIRVGNKYYLCDKAVWYVSDVSSGPWAIAVSVPQVIYTIPPKYPVYNVTYVYVYDYTPEVVYVGYYPGYYGTYVYGTTVVYGTGYVYPGWYGTVYYARPVTWGYAVHYSSYGGWAVRVGYPAPGVWYGRRAVRGIAHYARRDYWRDEYEDRRDRHRDEYDDRRDSQKDRYDDRRDTQKDRYDDRGKKYDDSRDTQKERYDDRRDTQSGRQEDRPPTQERTAGTETKRQNNVYADRNGNVQRKTDQGWQQRDKSGWSKPDSSKSGAGRSDLNRNYQARERGTQRTNDYRQSTSSGYSRGSGTSRSSSGRGGSGGKRRR
jgi:hypothetical protein